MERKNTANMLQVTTSLSLNTTKKVKSKTEKKRITKKKTE